MAKYIIEGGKQLKGTVRIGGSKNAALPIIAASLLVAESRLTNVPRIKDVDLMLEIIADLGGEFEWVGDNEVVIKSHDVQLKPLSDAARKLRASILFAGPLMARFKKAILPYPGGDIIGARPLGSHFRAFEKLGAKVESQEDIHLEARKFRGGTVVLDDPSVTGTENILMLAAAIDQETDFRLAATEPHVQDLCRFLVAAGAKIEGIGTPTLRVRGASALKKVVRHEIIPDELEISGFAALAAATHSHIKLGPIKPEFLDAVFLQLEKMKVNFKVAGDTLTVFPPKEIYAAARIQSGLYPKLVTDHLPPFAVLATQGEGPSLVHEWMYESRQNYIGELFKMGANTIIMDPHRALIIGPTPLYGREVTTYDIRSGMAMIVAALVAKGVTTISDIDHVDRGYENLEGRLRQLGATIKRVD